MSAPLTDEIPSPEQSVDAPDVKLVTYLPADDHTRRNLSELSQPKKRIAGASRTLTRDVP